MGAVAFVVVLLVMLAAAAVCFKISAWHRRESDWWLRASKVLRIDEDAIYDAKGVLLWARKERPTIRERLGPWRPPTERRAKS